MRQVRTFLAPVYQMVRSRWKFKVTGRKLFLDGHELNGICEYDDQRIRIRDNLDAAQQLDTVIHEFLHASYPFLCEQAVKEPATALAELLRRLGYIHIDEIVHD